MIKNGLLHIIYHLFALCRLYLQLFYTAYIFVASGSQKHADLASADAIRGTCLDMCPERERYIREERRRLNNYEMIPGTEVVIIST